MSKSLRINDRDIGRKKRPYLIAEVAQGHDGSLGMAHAFVDLAADAGADAVKFQTHIAAAESTLDEPFRVRFSSQDETRYAYWSRMEFTEPQWGELAQHAASRGIDFLSSAFSVKAVELLRRLGVPAWKVGSGEFRSDELLEAMVSTGKPVLYSTGMSTYEEIGNAVNRFQSKGTPFAILQCTSKYPTAFEEVGLNVIRRIEEDYGCIAGLSDHSGTIWPAIAAMAQGVGLIELHITFHRSMFGPDVSSSLTAEQFRLVSEGRDAIFALNSNIVDKDKMAADLTQMRALFTKSLSPIAPLKAGTVLQESLLTTRKPGTGIPASELPNIIGKSLARDVASDRVLTYEDLA